MNQQEDRELTQIRAQIAFGMDVQAFMRSSIGQYLTARANNDVEAALESLKTVDPEDAKAIRKLQNDAKCAESFLLWMGEAVTEGENSQRTYVDSES